MALEPEDSGGEVDDVAGADATPLCPQCLSDVPPRAAFCPKCSAPVGMFSTLDPMQQIQSMGWMYRRAISSGTSLIAVIGLWLILGPGLILSTVALIYGGVPRLDFVGFAQVLPFAALEVMFAVILYKGTRKYLHQRKARPDECTKCGYLLRHLTEHRCPECGTPFNPKNFEEPEGDENPIDMH